MLNRLSIKTVLALILTCSILNTSAQDQEKIETQEEITNSPAAKKLIDDFTFALHSQSHNDILNCLPDKEEIQLLMVQMNMHDNTSIENIQAEFQEDFINKFDSQMDKGKRSGIKWNEIKLTDFQFRLKDSREGWTAVNADIIIDYTEDEKPFSITINDATRINGKWKMMDSFHLDGMDTEIPRSPVLDTATEYYPEVNEYAAQESGTINVPDSSEIAEDISWQTDSAEPAKEEPPATEEERLLNNGVEKYNSSDFKGAIDDFTKAIAVNPGYTDAYLLRGRAKYGLKNYKGAIEDYNRILEINPEVRAVNWLYVYRGLASSALQNHKEAVEDYTKAFDDLSEGELQPIDFNFHDRAWPTLDEMIIIEKSFKAVAGETAPGLQDNSDITGEWVGDPDWGAEIVNFGKDNSYSSSWEGSGKKTYEVVYHSKNINIILVDSLLNSRTSTYKYLVAVTGGKSGEGRFDELKFRNKNRMALCRPWEPRDEYQIPIAFVYTRKNQRPPVQVLTLSDATDERVNEALKLFDKNIIAGTGYSQPISELNMEKVMDSLQSHGLMNRLDTTIYKTAAYLDHLNPEGFVKASNILSHKSKYNEAAFLLLTGQMRNQVYNMVQGEYDLAAYDTYAFPFENYLQADVDNSVFIIQTAVDYARNHDYGAYPRSTDISTYYRQTGELVNTIEDLRAARDYQKPFNDVLKILGLKTGKFSSGMMMNPNGEKDWDEETLYKNIYNTSDSLKALGLIGQMDNAVFKAARLLDQSNPEGFLTVSMMLLERHKYNEAAFLMYLGQVRSNYYNSVAGRSGGSNGDVEAMYGMIVNMSYLPLINVYLQTDVDNFIHVLKTVVDYYKKNDYPAYPRKGNMEKYDHAFIQITDLITKLETNKEELSENWYAGKNYMQKLVKEEKEIAANKKPVPVKNSSLIGTWSGPGEYNNAAQLLDVVTFEKGDSVIFHPSNSRDSEQDEAEKTTYVVDYNTNPIRIQAIRKDPNTGVRKTVNYLAEFLGENKLMFGQPYSNNETKFIPDRSQILTRRVEGEKNYFRYKKIQRTDAPGSSKNIPDKELQRFWNDNIQAIINSDKEKIITQTSFPLGDAEGIIDSGMFREFGFDRVFSNQKELSLALKDMDYKNIVQVQLDNGEVLLMLYILGRPYYTIRMEETAQHFRFGFLFKNEGNSWRLITASTGVAGNTTEDISTGQNELIHQGQVPMEKKLLLNRNIQSMINLDKNAIIAQTNFPLSGNWGTAIGLRGEAADWTPKDLASNLDKFLNPEIRSRMSEFDQMSLQEGFDHESPLTFNTYASTEVTQNDGEYHSKIVRMTFGKVAKEWKLINLDWDVN